MKCRNILLDGDSKMNIWFMHHDYIDANASIGEHKNDDTEEVYYLLRGRVVKLQIMKGW